MAIRNILLENEPLLREKSREVSEFDSRLALLLDDMFETMNHANGCGLAAPQIGILKRICVISPDGQQKYEIINPVIVKQAGFQVGYEGCLSVPNFNGKVKRPRRIVVEYQDRSGEKQTIRADGHLAVIFCHEIDHLDGILYVDKLVDGRDD